MNLNRPILYALPAVFLVLFFGVWGLRWGLPSQARADLFMTPDLRTPAFYQKVENAREELYAKIGMNPIAHYGRKERQGQTAPDTSNILSAYSSFLVRTHHGDEQQTLVMLSRINPFRGQWYPYTFQYGGAYVYPLGALLKGGQILGRLKLVPHAAFYYEHPEEIARVYAVIRFWSVIGLVFAVLALFFLTRALAGPQAAIWASCFFALTPACIGNAKMAKPHVWAAAWVLTSLYFCFRSKEDLQWKSFLAACISFGLAIGTALSQVAFAPFLIWACWTPTFSLTWKRVIGGALTTVAVFLITNFYLFAHFQDYRDEVYFLNQWYPFAVRIPALWEFLFSTLGTSYGTLLWIFVMVSFGAVLIQRSEHKLRTAVGLSAVVFVYVAFQNQSQHGTPTTSRVCLALLGLGCVSAGWLVQRFPWGKGVGVLCMASLLVTAVYYDKHFASDQVPSDNASLASFWIRDHVPAGSMIGQDQVIPHPFGFPPIDFARYHIVPINTPEFLNAKGPVFAVLPAWADEARLILLSHHFTHVQTFATSPIQKWGFADPFTNANFKLDIYEKTS